jgi:hypothetical protein
MGDGGFTAGSFEQDAAIVSGAQPAQAEFGGSEVVDASVQVGEAAANEIKLDFVERTCAGRGAKVNFAAGIVSLAGDAGGEKEELGHGLQIGSGSGLGGNTFGDGGEGGDAGLAHLAGQTHRLQRGINLERHRLVGPVHEVRVGADA